MNKRILCFGDSITWGFSPALDGRLDTRWPTVLQECLGPDYAILEEGQCGRNIATDDPAEGEKNGYRCILPCLETHTPLDMVIVMLGTNDCKHKYGYCVQDIAGEMQRFLQKVLTHRHFQSANRYKVLLIAPPPMSEAIHTSWLGDMFGFDEGRRKSDRLAEVYRKLAQSLDCLFLDAGEVAAPSPLDGVHLDAENQRRLGEAVARLVKAAEI